MFAVRYFVENVDAAISFYTKVFGFAVVEQYGPAMAILKKDNMNLWLAGPQSSAAKALSMSDILPSSGVNRIVFVTSDLEAFAHRLESSDAGIRIPLRRGPVGQQLVVQDPSGNYIEIFQQTTDV